MRCLLLALLLAGGHAGIAQEINPPGETPGRLPSAEAPQEEQPPAVAPDEFDLAGVDSSKSGLWRNPCSRRSAG